MWYEYLINALIGIVTGALSSWIVTIMFNKKAEKMLFDREKQIYSRFIEKVRTELEASKEKENIDMVIRTINEQPYLETFSNLNDDSIAITQEIGEILDEINVNFRRKKFDRQRISHWNSRLLKHQIKVLKFKIKTNKEKNKNG